MSHKPFTLALVIPCYNEEEVLPILKGKLDPIIQDLIEKNIITPKSFICFIDDGSRDHTWNIIDKYASEPLVRGLKLSRNFGQQNALLAGLYYVEPFCDAAITLDADMQDDINAIKEMCQKFLDGFEVVYGARNKRDTDSWFKRFSAESFYKVMQLLGVSIVPNHAHFRLTSKRAIQWLKEFEERNLFLQGVIPLIGLESTVVYYERQKRAAGETKYPFTKLLASAWDGITSFSIVPLRFITVVGFITLIISLVLSVWAVTSKFLGNAVSGWTSMILIVLFLGGVQMLSLGVIGEYIGKIYKETKRRPRFFIEKIKQ